jgi:imidazolonepropionase-like amidohydrolase
MSYPTKPDMTFTIKAARIFDGRTLVPADTVVVENGQIRDVHRMLKPDPTGETIDGAGCTLLPGLIDSHTHIMRNSLKQALAFGITTEMDMGTHYKFAAEIKHKQANGELLDWADLFSAGTLVTAPGGHGTEYGMKIPTITEPEEAQAFVDARISEGSDYIKVIYDDRRSYGPSIPTVSKETLCAIIRAARARRKLSLVHAVSYVNSRDALECGCNGLAHLFTDQVPEEDFGTFVAAARAFVVPTLTVLESIVGVPSGLPLLAHQGLSSYFSEMDRANLKRAFLMLPGVVQNYDAAVETTRQLKSARVPILAGSDAPNWGTVHGASLHRELELLVRAGLTPAEALAAATSIPATIFGLSDRGKIEAGKRADLLLVEGDPLSDIKATRNILAVWKRGKPLNRTEYLASIEYLNTEDKGLRGMPSPEGSQCGLVSDFEDMALATRFGMGWIVSTDSIAGGNSNAAFRVVAEGANRSLGSLLIEGEVLPGYPVPWSGAMFVPGAAPMQPVNLASKKRISFWAKGDPGTYRIMLLAKSYWPLPVSRFFATDHEWRRYTFNISDFDGMDGHDLSGIIFAAGPNHGKFRFQIDDLEFE